MYCQKRIGSWRVAEARRLLGDPLRRRASVDDDNVQNGNIFAFADPTSRYKELELEFAANSGLLRAVFIYPAKLTWKECRLQWGGKVTTAEANKGRRFYSYADRHLDVLVDSDGQVISLGLY